MQTNEQMLSAIENYLAQTEFPAEPELLYAPIGYSLAGGGKRLRPMLLTLSCGIFSDDVKQALPAAAAVEVFHNFTLLHDDIMDNAAVRRGKPSVHAKWGQNVAILSGDAMMICAYRLLSEDVELSISTRESADFRDRVMPFGVTVISAGSKTTPGGYAHPNRELEQWSINDNRTPREVEAAVRAKGLDPVWKDWSFFMQEEVETPALLTHSA